MAPVRRILLWALSVVSVTSSLFAGTATYGYRKTITIDSTFVIGAVNHTNFPVLVSLSDPDLRTVGNGGRVVSAQGYDIIFTGSDGTTRLDFEIETYDGATGMLLAWVKVPTLQVASNTVLYIYYGSSDIFSAQETTSATWSEGYQGVWHLDETPQGKLRDYQDSAPFENHGIGGNGSANHLPNRTTGQIGFGQYFDRTYSRGTASVGIGGTTVTFAGCGGCLPMNIQAGDTLVLDPGGGNQETFTVAARLSATQVSVTASATLNHSAETYVLYEIDPNNDMINVGDDPNLDLVGNQITIEAWLRHNITPDNGRFFGFINHKGFSQGYRFLFPQNSLSVQLSLPPGSVTSALPVSANAWHHVVGTYDGTTMRLYIDGVKDVNETAKTGNILSVPPRENDVWIGHGDQPVDRAWSYPWEGFLDEVRISKVARSGDWIATQYNNQSSPGTFYTVGAEQPGSYARATFDVNVRSIGTGGVLYATGQASLALGSRTVSFSGATLPSNVGAGDRIVLDPLGPNVETLYILSRDSATQVTLQTRATKNHVNEAYRIERSYGTLQSWEDDRNGNLVAENRRETGVVYNDGDLTGVLVINGSTTDSSRFLTLTVAPGQRHTGVAGTGAVLRPSVVGDPIRVLDDFTRIEWLEITGWPGASDDGVFINADHVTLRNLIVHDGGDALSDGFRLFESAGSWTATIENSIAYNMGRACYHVANDTGSASLTLNLENVTAFNCGTGGGARNGGVAICQTSTNVTRVTARNVLATGNLGADFRVNGIAACTGTPSWAISDANISGDATAPGPNSLTLRAAGNQFVSTTPAAENLHLKAGADAIDTGQVSLQFFDDIDSQLRALGTLWDVGADEFNATTAVKLLRFEAESLAGEVALAWETGSELDNLGFHLYRAEAREGPFERITSRIIPGLGSSPEGGQYRYRDRGLYSERTYYYELEDVDASGVRTRHGPVSATPLVGLGEGSSADGPSWTFGDPGGSIVTVSRPSPDTATLVLETRGFTVTLDGNGEPQLDVDPRRVSVEAIAGRKVEIVSVEALDVLRFAGLGAEPASLELVASRSGAVRLERGRDRGRRSRDEGDWAKLTDVGYQGSVKKAIVELSPFRSQESTGELLFARRIVVRLSFRKPDRDERASARRTKSGRRVAARLVTREPGLYTIGYEEVFGRARSRSAVTLTRQGKRVPYRVEPGGGSFRPGTRLFFWSEGGALNPYGREAVYELEWGEGESMPVAAGQSRGPELSYLWHTLEREENRYYQAALLDASDLWFWDLAMAGSRKSYAFDTTDLAPATENGSIAIRLQGTSDLPEDPDHHVRIFVNGSFLGESFWNGKTAKSLTFDLPPGLLREGANDLEVDNVGDTGASYSFVMLDGFDVTYPRRARVLGGVLSGRASRDGVVSTSAGFVLDKTSWEWIEPTAVDDGIRFPVVEGHEIVVVSEPSLHRPEVRNASSPRIEWGKGTFDYLAVVPRELSAALEPLVAARRRQGLSVRVVAVEDAYDELGFGEKTPDAIQRLVSLAYRDFRVRYVLLVGDATYDFKDYLATGKKNHIPPRMVRTSYLWTASDPSYGAVHGNDILPDVAIGRLPAASVDELRAMVTKILDYERDGGGLLDDVVLVADNADAAGDFPGNAEEIASTVLAGASPRRIYLDQLGAAQSRDAIRDSLDSGVSLVSYVGHGGIHLWADENLLDLAAVDGLSPQSRRPLLLTMNCLNGYFHFPFFDSLSEKLLKAEGKGVVAAFSPSGLSLDSEAHRFHTLLLRELVAGGNTRLGDAVMKAQAAYVDSGALPELVTIYNVLGDPALVIRP